MRLARDIATLAGPLALAAALVLLSPGVRAVKADDSSLVEHRMVDRAGPTCDGGGPRGAEVVAAQLSEIQRRQAAWVKAAAAAGPDSGEIVVLNNRGYNYGPNELESPAPRAPGAPD